MSAPRTQVRDRIAAHDPLSQRAPAEADAIGPATRESLAERYKQMAHEGHEHRGVDTALRGLDLGIAGVSLVVLSPVLAAIAISIGVTSGGRFHQGIQSRDQLGLLVGQPLAPGTGAATPDCSTES